MRESFQVRSPLKSLIAILLVVCCSCSKERVTTQIEPSFRSRVGALLGEHCASCHAGSAPPAGWRADSYVGAIGCTDDGSAATVGGDRAPILRALARPDHAALLSEDERNELARWVAIGAPSTSGGVHSATFADPRTPGGHARFVRDRRYRPMLDPTDPDACGRCHAGAPVASEALAAPGATPCTTCHVEEGGALACTTCHGSSGRAYPPRDRCFFPEDAASAGAHDSHAGPSASHVEGFPCSTCHPMPTSETVRSTDGAHMNGHVEVFFDYALAGATARFDASTKRCTGTCHARGGARPIVAWNDDLGEQGVSCNNCHSSPPAGHYAGACVSCHREANAEGTSLTSPRLHVDGKVDLGDGSGRCGACHGVGDDPWPTTGAHPAHGAPTAAVSVRCETCHTVPTAGDRHPSGRGSALVSLRGLAVRGGARATFDVTTKTCAETYCHAGRGASVPSPGWTDGPSAAECGACHALPPPAPHSSDTTCGATASCHQGSLTSSTSFTAAGKAAHVDGFITRTLP